MPLLLLACTQAGPTAGDSAVTPASTLPMDREADALGDAARDPAEGTSAPDEQGDAELAGGPSLPLTVLDLSELPARTTPDALSIELAQNIDQLKLQLNLNDARGYPVSACQSFELQRVGSNAVSWPLGDTLTVPLGYTETLPEGLYTQSVYMLLGAGDYDVPYEILRSHHFEVHAGGLRPISSTEFTHAVRPTTIGPNGEIEIVGEASPPEGEIPPNPCPPPAMLTDVTTAEGATSRVDFDSWSGVDTIQPFRWRSSVWTDGGSHIEPTLVFHARDAAAGRIRFELLVPSDVPESDFEVEVAGAGSVALDEAGEVDARGWPSSTPTTWYGQSGRISVHIEPGGTLRVELTDIALTRSRMVTEPEVTRTVASGNISGAWVLE